MKNLWIFACLTSALAPAALRGSDFRHAVIVISHDADPVQKKAATMLTEEIEKRTQLRLPITSEIPSGRPAFVLGTADAIKKMAPRLAGGISRGKAEGFTLVSSAENAVPLAVVAGNDDRGVIFGTGYLLRQLTMERQRLDLAPGIQKSTAPQMAIRGQQLGYRPKTNAYDAWSVPMWDQYMRELAIFGTNTVELIPPRSDDADDSPHFPLPKMEMMVEMSRIASEYDLNVSVWFPAMDADYSDPKTVDAAVKEWADVYSKLPRIDAIFVPGGDPGHTEPKYLLALLEKQAASLRRYHPHAEVWISPQSFDKAWLEEFYGILDKQPAWLTGVVYGPQVREPIAKFRERIPKRYPIRFYPDITHSWRSEFPVPKWDGALASTEGREVINPRPLDETAVFHYFQPYITGFVTYSEGCNDDVNKFIWSSLGWNPDANVKDILRDYSHFFIGPQAAEGFASGLMALEQNWRGPLLSTYGVDVTLQQFQALETGATPQQKLNWRFQEALYRAYYDAFIRTRLITETQQEELALSQLQRFHTIGLDALNRAETILNTDMLTPIAREYRARVFELAEALYQSIHMQLSVARYKAIALERGANLDAIDFALNNRVWLKNRFEEIRKMSSASDRVAKVNEILNWTNPGPGGFYDDLGNPAQEPHLVMGRGFDKDPAGEASARSGVGNGTAEDGWRTSWVTHALSLYDHPLEMRYTGLDRSSRYKVRVVYGGDMPRVPIRLMANHTIEVHPLLKKPSYPTPQEFDIPHSATQSGTLELEWSGPPGLGGNGREAEVAEVWLIRVP